MDGWLGNMIHETLWLHGGVFAFVGEKGRVGERCMDGKEEGLDWARWLLVIFLPMY